MHYFIHENKANYEYNINIFPDIAMYLNVNIYQQNKTKKTPIKTVFTVPKFQTNFCLNLDLQQWTNTVHGTQQHKANQMQSMGHEYP